MHELALETRLPTPAYTNTLTNNWRAILAYNCREALRYVRVDSGVALVTNGTVAVRCPAQVPDGFYVLDPGGRLAPVPYRHWGAYPDPRSCAVDFAGLALSAPISKEVSTEFIMWLEYARQARSPVMVDRRGAFSAKVEHTFNLADYIRGELPITGEERCYDPYALKLALCEMLRYDQVYLSHKDTLDGGVLVIGQSWAQCAMLAESRHSDRF